MSRDSTVALLKQVTEQFSNNTSARDAGKLEKITEIISCTVTQHITRCIRIIRGCRRCRHISMNHGGYETRTYRYKTSHYTLTCWC